MPSTAFTSTQVTPRTLPSFRVANSRLSARVVRGRGSALWFGRVGCLRLRSALLEVVGADDPEAHATITPAGPAVFIRSESL